MEWSILCSNNGNIFNITTRTAANSPNNKLKPRFARSSDWLKFCYASIFHYVVKTDHNVTQISILHMGQKSTFKTFSSEGTRCTLRS